MWLHFGDFGRKHWRRLYLVSEWQSHHPLTPSLIIDLLLLQLNSTERSREDAKTSQQFHERTQKRSVNKSEGKRKNKVSQTCWSKPWHGATRAKIEFPCKWCNPLAWVTRCYYLNLKFINRWQGRPMTRFPPCPSCTELPADLGRLPASVCKRFAAGMYKQAVKIGFGLRRSRQIEL